MLVELAGGGTGPAYGRADVILFDKHGGLGKYTASLDQRGHYEINNVDPGTYDVRFDNYQFVSNVTQTWFGDTPFQSSSTTLTISALGSSVANATFSLASSLSGTISYAAGVAQEDHLGAASAFLFNHATSTLERTTFGRATDRGDGQYTITGLPAGDYLLRFGDQTNQALLSTSYWKQADFIYDAQLVSVSAGASVSGNDGTLGPGGLSVGQFGGSDRYATSVAVSQAGFDPGVPCVFLVNGENYPDALSAGPAAAKLGGPVLLTAASALPDSVRVELKRLAPERIVIIGGLSAISQSVENEIGAIAPVSRIGGRDRFETSRLTAKAFWVSAGSAFIATGANFPDALSSVPAAALSSAPVVLVSGSSPSIDAATSEALQSIGVHKITVVGGTASISQSFEASVNRLPYITDEERYEGQDRYSTSLAIGTRAFGVADVVFLANGNGFPDALSGGALAGGLHAPVFLVHGDCVPDNVIDEILQLQPNTVILLGGPASLNEAVAKLQSCGT